MNRLTHKAGSEKAHLCSTFTKNNPGGEHPEDSYVPTVWLLEISYNVIGGMRWKPISLSLDQLAFNNVHS